MEAREDVNKLLGINKSIDMWAMFLIKKWRLHCSYYLCHVELNLQLAVK